jgi:hypothetical protein
VVEQSAQDPSPVVEPANCFATRCGRSRIQSGTMQLGLRFAAAKLPGLRAGREAGSLLKPGSWCPEEQPGKGAGQTLEANVGEGI